MFLSSCNDWLDEQKYTKKVAMENFYQTTDDANAGVLAVLDKMRESYGDNWFSTLEINTEYVYPKGVYTSYGQYTGLNNNTHISRCATDWQRIYRAIQNCNTALSRIPESTEMKDSEKDAYCAELYFLRALNYFMLVRTYGGVPVRTVENMTTWDLRKSSAEEVYTQIQADLDKAVANCPDKPRLVGTPGKNAAKALKAWVCLYTKDYSTAKKLAGEVISSNDYSLVKATSSDDMQAKIFGADLTTSTEEVFYIKTSRTDNKCWKYPMYLAHPKYEYAEGKAVCGHNGYYTHYTDRRNPVIANWDDNDLRKNLNVAHYVFGKDAYGTETCLLLKYRDPDASGSNANVNIPLIRYTDVLLVYSEACARAAGSPVQESVNALNMIRRRAYGKDPEVADASVDYKLSDCSTMDKYIDLLIKEERYERFNEGKHWFFEVRLGKAAELINENYRSCCPWPPTQADTQGQAVDLPEKFYLLKIPDSEFEYNKAMDQAKDQNPGYTVE